MCEQIYKKTGYGKKSDIFGVGVLGYIMLSSWSPWSSSDPKQLMLETMTSEVRYYPSHWTGVSEEGECALAKFPSLLGMLTQAPRYVPQPNRSSRRSRPRTRTSA